MAHPYAFIFGKPKEGVHKYRIFGYAAVDIIGSILIAVFITYYWGISLWKTVLGTFIVGEVLHYLFGVQTEFLSTIKLIVPS